MREVIGLIPAAGTASRIAPLPCSKELYPVGFRSVNDGHELRPKVVSHYLLEKMRLANITNVFIILREGKWDIPAYFRDGKMLDMNLAYLMMDLPYGVPYTLDQAYPFVKDYMIALGFPDILFQPENAYSKLLDKQEESGACVVLGIFPASQTYKTDMVEVDKNGRVLSVQIKPAKTDLIYTWQIAVWTPDFTRFMHDYLLSVQGTFKEHGGIKAPELFAGDVINAAIKISMHVDSVLFEEGKYLDIGTPDDLIRAVQSTTEF